METKSLIYIIYILDFLLSIYKNSGTKYDTSHVLPIQFSQFGATYEKCHRDKTKALEDFITKQGLRRTSRRQ